MVVVKIQFRGNPYISPLTYTCVIIIIVHTFFPIVLEHVNRDHDFSDSQPHDQRYTDAARHALKKHAALITNVNAGEISPQLYSSCLISAETFSLIGTHNGTNRYKMLIVFEEVQSRVALNAFSLLKFVDILRGYQEYEDLANHLRSM